MVILRHLLEQAYYDWLGDGSQISWKEYLQSIDADEWF